MWESLPPKKLQNVETRFFLDWVNDELFHSDIIRQAEDTFLQAAKQFPEIARFQTTPQSAPWHCEGPVLSDHVKRILAGIYAIVNGAQLLEIEELAREKSLAGEIYEMQERGIPV